MIIRNATAQQLYKAVRATAADYEGNVRFKNGPDPVNQKGTGHRLTLTVHASSKPGGRRSNTGRKVAAACWHVHREFFRHLYDLAPEAVIQSALATYTSKEDFEKTFEVTGDRNMGSAFEPCAVRNACECDDDDDKRDKAEMAAWDDAQRCFRGIEKSIPGHAQEMREAEEEAQANVDELEVKVKDLQATIDNETPNGRYYEG